MMPSRLTRPTVGFKPTSPFTAAGHRILPSVSVPIAATARLADTATALNAEELAVCAATGISPEDFAKTKAA